MHTQRHLLIKRDKSMDGYWNLRLAKLGRWVVILCISWQISAQAFEYVALCSQTFSLEFGGRKLNSSVYETLK